MSFAFTTIGMNLPPPRRTAAVVTPSANPATVPASLPSSRMAVRDRAQSWRGKYLRALNICSEDIEHARRLAAQRASATPTTAKDSKTKSRLRAMNFHRSDYRDHHALSRSYSSSTEKEEEERKSRERATQQHQQPYTHRAVPQQHQIHAVPLRAPSTTMGRSTSSSSTAIQMPVPPTAANPYGFPMRSNIARGRRCHTDPLLIDERVSAPIQIPSAMGGNSQLDGHGRNFESRVSGGGGLWRHAPPRAIQTDVAVVATNNNHSATANVRLLSWEEPVAMLKAADAVAKGWRMPMASMELGVRRGRELELDDDHMEEEDEDDLVSDGGDIFQMDEYDDDAIQNNQQSERIRSRCRDETEPINIVTSGREKRVHHPFDDEEHGGHGQYDVFGGHGRGADLSQSFVPPHQLVDRSDCFSIGLRDGFKKRRPVNHI